MCERWEKEDKISEKRAKVEWRVLVERVGRVKYEACGGGSEEVRQEKE